MTFANNKRARFDYEIQEKFEAGIELSGHEVKSVKEGKASLGGAHGIIRGGEAFIIGLDIASFQPNNAPPDYDPKKIRRLLLSKKEIKYLTGKLQDKLTLVATKMYSKNGLIKVELGLGKGRKKKDKRDYLKKKESDREIRRRIKD